ncbi:DCC1-like thiol-disulfide oxidoreductase family protein [Chryseolinea lacunae]|uniref:DUF393 domain-containing protein n=1 Tax=Chryseolinea lacunae TaxID=2801331 RepID=A0ABS1L267_9BACT|nr:DCC1-like thiol-disulfide oxidoreductase family protein [Chryseolinea lacunae]MBL0745027.1 DUF393 domain-containing protein [Chryseolinea lacunae]
MKTLKNHIILYDDECPMCDLYTRQFVRTGMLDQNGRAPYAQADALHLALDKERARNEIAMVDTESGEVVYGINSFFKILINRFPALEFLFRWKIFQWLAARVYAFISYNRKVIVPSTRPQALCTPDFKLTYRIAYIVFTWLFTSVILNAYTQHLAPLVAPSNLTRELAVCGGQILFQGFVVALLYKDRVVEYLGNMMTVSFIGALLLLPGLLFTQAGEVSAWAHTAWFMMVVTIMFLEHWRRVKLLRLPANISMSWVFYRVLVLSIIL